MEREKWNSSACKGTQVSKMEQDNRGFGMDNNDKPEREINLDFEYLNSHCIINGLQARSNQSNEVDQDMHYSRNSEIDKDVAGSICSYLDSAGVPWMSESSMEKVV